MEPEPKKRGNEKGRTSDIVAQRVRARRQALGIDLASLAARLTSLNWPIPVAALSRLENGQRRIDVDDLMALAVALNVAPNELLFEESSTELNAGTALPAWLRQDEARLWAYEGIHLDPEAVRKVWASRLENHREQLMQAKAKLYEAVEESEGESTQPQLLAQFMVEEAQGQVDEWTEKVNAIALRELELRSMKND